MKSVVFLCTGNSCRSIIAEAIGRQRGRGKWQAFSAGVSPVAEVNPDALDVLRRHGVPAGGLNSKSIESLGDIQFDLAVTLCEHAVKTCPQFPSVTRHRHWPISDPSLVAGEAREHAFEEAFTNISAMVDRLLLAELVEG